MQSREDFLIEAKKHLPSDCIAFELGVLNGDFSWLILNILKPKQIYLIDPYEANHEYYKNELGALSSAYSTQKDYENILLRFKKEIEQELVMVRKEYSHNAINHYSDNSIDFIYHDASHLFNDIKHDLNDWLPKIKPDGLICGHDYVNNNFGFGVIQAVDEFCKEHNFEMILFNENGGDFALKRK